MGEDSYLQAKKSSVEQILLSQSSEEISQPALWTQDI